MKRMWSKNELIRITALLLASGQLNEVDSKDFKINGEKAIQVWDGTLDLTSSLTIVASFCKVVRNFNELQFIFNCRVKNETDSTISILNDSAVCHFASLPENILSKIYDHDGKNLVEETLSCPIAYSSLFVSNTDGTADDQNPRYSSLFWRKDLSQIRIYLEGTGIDVASNQVLDLEARISLAL